MSDAERTDQYVEQVWETPPLDEIARLSAAHVDAMESMDDVEEVWQQAGMHHVLLRTIGRRSGKEHKVALPVWLDPEGRHVVVASYRGRTRPPVLVPEPHRPLGEPRSALSRAGRTAVLVRLRDPRR